MDSTALNACTIISYLQTKIIARAIKLLEHLSFVLAIHKITHIEGIKKLSKMI